MILKLLVFTLIYVIESKISEILLIGLTFDKKEAFTADQPAFVYTCLIMSGSCHLDRALNDEFSVE